MKTITRSIVHPEFEITGLNLDNNNVFPVYINREQFDQKVDLAKTYLIKEFNAKKGQIVLISTAFWPNYPIWFFACSELGMKFIVTDFPKTSLAMEQMPIMKMVDIILWDLLYPPGYDAPAFADKKLNVSFLDSYNPSDIISPIWCEPNDVILIATSSGTTATPKLIELTHEFFFKNMIVNADLYNLQENEKCWHNKNLQHGAVLGVFFLPTINRCKSHFHAPFGYLTYEKEELLRQASIENIQDKKIDRIMIFFNQIEWFAEVMDITKKQHDSMTIHYVGNNKTEYIDKLVGEFRYTMIPMFGSTETGGPLFYTEITPDNYKNWNTKTFGTASPFFKNITTVDDNLLEVTSYDNTVHYTGDRFEINDGVFTFIGRQDLYRINGKNVYSHFLNAVIEDVTGLKREFDFDIVFDSDNECWYIRTTQELDLEELHKRMEPHIDDQYYGIRKQIVGSREQFTINSWKFSPAMVRLAVTKGTSAIDKS
jgi:acyl-coenzyme A synthetase/AMP-(fatty) acid ligase